jgi:hypothetical protein
MWFWLFDYDLAESSDATALAADDAVVVDDDDAGAVDPAETGLTI